MPGETDAIVDQVAESTRAAEETTSIKRWAVPLPTPLNAVVAADDVEVGAADVSGELPITAGDVDGLCTADVFEPNVVLPVVPVRFMTSVAEELS